jgi:hypothetical protein
MRIRERFGKTVIIVAGGLVATALVVASLLSAGQNAPAKAATHDGSEADRAAIERLQEEFPRVPIFGDKGGL